MIHIHIFLRMHIITSLCECVRIYWMCMNMLNVNDFIGKSNVVIHIHIFLRMRIIMSLCECVRICWMCMNMLNEKDFIEMCNDVTSRSIIQNKSYRLTLFKGKEHLWMMKKKTLKKNPSYQKPISYSTEFRLDINLNNFVRKLCPAMINAFQDTRTFCYTLHLQTRLFKGRK